MKEKLLSILALVTIGVANMQAQTMTGVINTQPCNNNGQVTVSTTGLTPPITYNYYVNGTSVVHSNVNATTDSYSGIAAMQQMYGSSSIYVMATDGTNSASYSTNFTLPFTYSITVDTAICPAPGKITINNLVGGTAPFSYHFTNYATLQSYTTNPAFVPVGQYSVSVTDAAGCNVAISYTANQGIMVSNTSTITANITGTSANCTNGTASIIPTGGVTPFTYLWNNGATTPNISGLSRGNYNCTITDAGGCSNSFSYYVQQSVNITFNSSTTNATCVQTNGSILGFVSGGTAPYNYLWSNGATTQNISGLTGNTSYQVQITDVNNCQGTGYVYVSATTPINVTYLTSPSSCTLSTGAATVTPTGGTAPYTVTWNTYPTSTSGVSISNKPSGNYGFTVTDAAGCIRTGTVFIPPVSTINAFLNNGSVTCPVTTGNLLVTASGTNGPFTYLWNNGATTPSITGVTIGNYNCTITDALNCSIKKYGSLIQSTPLTVGFASTPSSCIYTADGSILANATGGLAPYTYFWSNSQSGANATGLTTGNYYVSVTDANGCHNSYNNNMANVGYNAANNSCYCTITGTVYADANNNCTRDAGENGINNIQIHCTGLGYAYTNSNGVYSFMAPTGTYTLTESIQQIYPLASCQANNTVVSVTAGSGCTSPANFANTIFPIHDLHIITTSVNQPVPGNTYYQKVIVQNEGTVTENTVQLGYTHDGQLSYTNCTPWALTQQNAGVYPNWFSMTSGFPTLNAGTSSSSYINYGVPTNVPINTVVNFYDSIAHAAPISTVWLTDNTPWNNVDNHQATVVSSFDPNFKEVTPKGTGPQGYISTKDSVLTYVVHFQNEGTYYAQNIVVLDSLDAHLDLSTLRPGYSDKNYTTSVSENGVIKFKFNNINLPWKSGFGDLMSSAMFTYSVKMKKNLAPGTKIKNTAAIYFDYNEPVITNTTLNTIKLDVSVKEIKGMTSDDVILYPNPTNSTFSVLINSTKKTESEVSIIDISGRVISNKSVTLQIGENTVQENTHYLQSGIYFFQLKSNDLLITKKLIVVK